MAFVRNNNNNNNNRPRHNNYNNNRPRHNNYGNNSGAQQSNPNGGPRRHVNRVNQVFESNGPDGRIRGTAAQIVEKYTTMSRDVGMSGDRVLAQNYLQHAEHYQRLLTEITEENAAFEKEREATRQTQQAQPEISGEAAAEGFVGGGEQSSGEQQPQQPREERQPRPQRSEQRTERPERQDRPERAERPQRERERRPADDIADNELPSFLHVPIKEGKPEAAAPIVERAPRKVAVPRPRRAAASTPDADIAEQIQSGPSDE